MMSSFWSVWISIISLGLIFGCFLLLRWCLKNSAGVPEGEAMHHEFDGIVEINNPLPRWWTIMFYAVIFWGLLLLLLYPGLGNYEGLLKWKSSNQGIKSLAESQAAVEKAVEEGYLISYDREVRFADEKYGPVFDEYAALSIDEILQNEEALKTGQRLFLQNCAQCHGSDARGQTGFPNLTDSDWLYGGSHAKIKETLHNGRRAAMPAQLAVMGEEGVKETVAYVLSLSGREVDPELAAKGKQRFVICSACHGPDGKGNQLLGAPNLTDQIWLYGSTEQAITETVSYGRNGVMPAFNEILGEKKIHLVAGYVYSLSNK